MSQKPPICLSCDHYLQKDSDPSGESEFCGKSDSGPPQAIRFKPTACTDHQDPKCRPIEQLNRNDPKQPLLPGKAKWEWPENVAKHCRETGEQRCHVCYDIKYRDNVSTKKRAAMVEIEVGLLPTDLPNGPKFRVFEVTVPDMGRRQRARFNASIRMADEPCNPGEARMVLSFDPDRFVK